jgi:hypothetical protein
MASHSHCLAPIKARWVPAWSEPSPTIKMKSLLKSLLKKSPELALEIGIDFALDELISNPKSKRAQIIRRVAVPFCKALMERFPEDFVDTEE